MSANKCLEKFEKFSDSCSQQQQQSIESKDEVDFIPRNFESNITKDANHNNTSAKDQILLTKKLSAGSLYGDCEVKNSLKSSLSTLEKLSFFTLHRKQKTLSESSAIASTTKPTQPPHHKHRFVKSASIARLLGNTYNTRKFEKELKNLAADKQLANGRKIGSSGACAERFHQRPAKDEDLNCFSATDVISLEDFQDDSKVVGAKAFRTISRGLGKLWWKRSQSVEISTPDPEYKVSYLGNVLTGWAKGDGCVEKPLSTLWRNYTQNNKPDVIMRVRVCASGLKATTRQHGLTEYWANRITHCSAPKNFPRVFCWIYRHEGRKLKHELRCHAVLCAKESIAQDICNTLRENLDRALRDFKREKILRQNARLSLANAVYDNPSLPRRKILLSVGGNNYRPPLERSKSAPKLMAIEEAIGEEEGEECEETNEPEMRPCCQKDSLYPAMTLGRRRCRRGHSIRRTGAAYVKPNLLDTFCANASGGNSCKAKDSCRSTIVPAPDQGISKSITSLGSNSDEDDLDKLLSYHDYDTRSPLAGELMSYFDMKLHTKTSSLTDLNADNNEENTEDDAVVLLTPTIQTDPSPKLRPSLSLDILDNCDEECGGDCADGDDEDENETDELFYRQAAILNLLHRSSLRKMANLSMSSDDSSMEVANKGIRQQHSLDSDEGSISSGCETASTATTNVDDSSLKYKQQIQSGAKRVSHHQESVTPPAEEEHSLQFHHQRLAPHNTITYCSTNTIQLKLTNNCESLRRFGAKIDKCDEEKAKRLNEKEDDGSESEFSDESGYVEFQEKKFLKRQHNKTPVTV